MKFNKEEIICRQTGDKIIKATCDNGPDIYISEMKGFSTVSALYGTRYGSVNNKFRKQGEKEFTEVPNGIAHYLEHKLFENPDEPTFEKFARIGAQANAYTSFERTCYLFACTDKYIESLKILLDFVQTPYFTDENVQKEQGIIAQEIKMTEDSVDGRAFYNLLKCLYKNHPVRIDIAGTVESISHITKELLYKCYNTFYSSDNMVLSIAGNVNADEILALCEKEIKPGDTRKIESAFPNEPETVEKHRIETVMEIGIPTYYIGFRLPSFEGVERTKASVYSELMLHTICDENAPFYRMLAEKGWVNSSFSYEIFAGSGYFTILFSCTSPNYEEVYKAICEELDNIKQNGIDEKRFELAKLGMYGSEVRDLNEVSTVAANLISAGLDRVSPFETFDILSKVTVDDVNKFIKNINTQNSAISVVHK